MRNHESSPVECEVSPVTHANGIENYVNRSGREGLNLRLLRPEDIKSGRSSRAIRRKSAKHSPEFRRVRRLTEACESLRFRKAIEREQLDGNDLDDRLERVKVRWIASVERQAIRCGRGGDQQVRQP